MMKTRSSTTGGIRRRRVCLFGTSANPPTGDGGHVGIVNALATTGRKELDEIRILPVYHHPFSKKRDHMVSYQDRLNMCRLAFQNSDNKDVLVTVSNAEERCFEEFFKDKQADDQAIFDRRVGTADLLDMLCREEPDTDFCFCLGADTFLDLTSGKWKRSNDVIQLLQGRLWIIPRQSHDNKEIDSSTRQERLLQERIDEINRRFGVDDNNAARLLTVPTLQPISSTMVRNCHDAAQLETLLVPSVLDYIQKHHLYSFQRVSDIPNDVQGNV